MTLVDMSSDEEGRERSLATATALMTERMEIHSAGVAGAGGGEVGGMVAIPPRLDKRLPTPLVPRDSDHLGLDVDTVQATATNALVSIPGDEKRWTSTGPASLLLPLFYCLSSTPPLLPLIT